MESRAYPCLQRERHLVDEVEKHGWNSWPEGILGP